MHHRGDETAARRHLLTALTALEMGQFYSAALSSAFALAAIGSCLSPARLIELGDDIAKAIAKGKGAKDPV